MKIKTSVKFLLFNLRTTFFRILEWIQVVLCYYRKCPSFIWVDGLFAWHYVGKNPHRISKAFLKAKGEENIYAYGETPLTTMDHILQECRILAHDIFYELGCGSGRGCFWVHYFIRCTVRGVDYLPTFILKAQSIKQRLKLSGLHFMEQDMTTIDFKEATAIYLYGTCLGEETIRKLVQQFHALSSGCKVITVSYPLTDYCEYFRVEKYFTASYPWGRAFVFLNIRN